MKSTSCASNERWSQLAREELIALNMRGPYGPMYAASRLHAIAKKLSQLGSFPSRRVAMSGPDWAAWDGRYAARKPVKATPDEIEAAKREQARAAQQQCRIVTWIDDEYPPLLRSVPMAPPVLYVKGSIEALQGSRAVAIVGSRKATVSYKEAASRIAMELAKRGVTIISGLAKGIDAHAHIGCIDGGGRTVAVLGHGLHTLYPSDHRFLADRVVQSGGALASFYPLGVPPKPYRFPARNWVIAGLAAGVVIVQGALTSGAIITVDAALAMGRDVFALPGPVGHPLSEGPHALLRDGAVFAMDYTDLLPLFPDLSRPTAQGVLKFGDESLSHESRKVIEALDQGATTLDRLTSILGVNIGELTATLTRLEMDGHVRRDELGQYMSVRREH